MKYCSKCENKLIEGVRFCLNCGADVNSVKCEAKKTVNKDVKDTKKCKPKSRLDTRLFDVI